MATSSKFQVVPGVFAMCIALGFVGASCELSPGTPTPVAAAAPEVASPVAQDPVKPAPVAPKPVAEEQGKPEQVEPEPAAQEPAPQEPPPRDIAEHAFPPVMPDIAQHQDAWQIDGCLRCHETGVQDAPVVRHVDMPAVLLTAKCRTCHVFVPGQAPRAKAAADETFDANAFPPMIPASPNHGAAWWRDDCLLCHEGGLRGAPKVEHKGMPRVLLASKCRSCHVQVRAVEADDGTTRR